MNSSWARDSLNLLTLVSCFLHLPLLYPDCKSEKFYVISKMKLFYSKCLRRQLSGTPLWQTLLIVIIFSQPFLSNRKQTVILGIGWCYHKSTSILRPPWLSKHLQLSHFSFNAPSTNPQLNPNRKIVFLLIFYAINRKYTFPCWFSIFI